jgi:hypothetical protein
MIIVSLQQLFESFVKACLFESWQQHFFYISDIKHYYPTIFLTILFLFMNLVKALLLFILLISLNKLLFIFSKNVIVYKK